MAALRRCHPAHRIPINLTGSNNAGVHARTARANEYRALKIVNRSVRHWFGTDPSSNPCRALITASALLVVSKLDSSETRPSTTGPAPRLSDR